MLLTRAASVSQFFSSQGLPGRGTQCFPILQHTVGETTDQTRRFCAINLPNGYLLNSAHSLTKCAQTYSKQSRLAHDGKLHNFGTFFLMTRCPALLKVTKRCVDSLWLPTLDVATFKYFSLSFKILKTNETSYNILKIPYNHTMHLLERRLVYESD